MTETKADRPVVSALEGVGLNLPVLPSKVLHLLQDGVIAELQAYEQRALQVISEQKGQQFSTNYAKRLYY